VGTTQKPHCCDIKACVCVCVAPCRKFSLDDLLTNVMIYWVSGCIVPSMRFYKENFSKGLNQPHSK